MTLRQVWRFLRDCQIAGSDATLAQFDRIYIQGKKNHYTLLGTGEVNKFDFLYQQGGLNGLNAAVRKENEDSSDFEEEDENSDDLN